MPAEPCRHHLNEIRIRFLSHLSRDFLHGLVHTQYVVSVDTTRLYPVGRGALGHAFCRQVGRLPDISSQSVILTDQENRQFLQRCYVETFVKLRIRGGPIAEKTTHYL